MKLLDWAKVIIAASGAALVFYFILRDYLINDLVTMLSIIALNRYAILAYPTLQSRTELVIALTLVAMMVIIVIWYLDKRRKTPDILD